MYKRAIKGADLTSYVPMQSHATQCTDTRARHQVARNKKSTGRRSNGGIDGQKRMEGLNNEETRLEWKKPMKENEEKIVSI